MGIGFTGALDLIVTLTVGLDQWLERNEYQKVKNSKMEMVVFTSGQRVYSKNEAEIP
jgi:hypothetical protein